MADINENLAIIDEFTLRLQSAVIGAEQTTTKHQYWTEGPIDGTIETQQGPMKTLRGLIGDWRQDADLEVANAIVGYDVEVSNKFFTYDNQFEDYLDLVGFEPAVSYAAGIDILRRSQTVVENGATYYWIGNLPITTSGDFSSELDWLLAPISGGIELPEISFSSGGQLLRKSQTIKGSDGEWYIWTGDFPKVIPSASTVESQGGTVEGAFNMVAGVPPSRPSMKILSSAAGLILNPGSFEYGATISIDGNSLAQFGTGRLYRWAGTLPKVVDVNSTPESSGGINESNWIEIDASLPVLGNTIISETPPFFKAAGQKWKRCTDMKEFTWYKSDEADPGQWVEDNPSMGASRKEQRIPTTVAVVAIGSFAVGDHLELTDRANAAFDVVSGGTANGIEILDAGGGNTAVLVNGGGIISAKAFGAKLDWNGVTGTDDTLVLQRIHQLGVNYSLDGKFALVTGSLEFYNNRSVYPFGGGIHKSTSGYIFTTNGIVKEDCKVYGGFFTGNLLASFADCRGTAAGFNNSARSIKFIDCRTAGIDVAFNWDNARVCHIVRGRYACKTAVIYTNKSAECTIDSALFVKDQGFATIGSAGLKSFSGVDGYPEGLSVHKTLFYRFEYNLDVLDLFIADFIGCFFDSGGLDVKRNRVRSGTKTEGIKFTSCWWFTRGVEWGDASDVSPKQFRSQMLGNHFSFMTPGTDVQFNKFAHAVTVDGSVHDSDNTGVHIGYVSVNQNNGIILSNLSFQNYDSYVQMKGSGEHNLISGIPNRDNLTTPLFLEYAVNISDVEGYSIQTEQAISGGTFAAGATIASIDNILLSSGMAYVSFEITGLSAPSSGFLKLFAYQPSTTIASADVTLLPNLSLIAYTLNDKAIRVTVPIKVLRATKIRFLLANESGSSPTITAGAFADSMVVTQ